MNYILKDIIIKIVFTSTVFLALNAKGQSVAAGAANSYTLCIDGTLRAWGDNSEGGLGNGSITTGGNAYSNIPVQVSNLTGIVSISSGWGQALALKNDGTVWSWGNGIYGELGNNSHSDTNVPVKVDSLSNVVAVQACGLYSMALKSDGTVWGWGWWNGVSEDSVPRQVDSLSEVIAIAGGDATAYALKRDSTVWAWGQNSQGQLGNGNHTDSYVPIQVTSLNSIIAIAGAGGYGLALKNDGTVWAWGMNYNGELGNGTYTNSNLPIQVNSLNNIIAIAAADDDGQTYEYSLALKNDGTVWAWGYNGAGQLGNGTYATSNVPIQVSTLNNVLSISAGANNAIALKNDSTVWTWGTAYLGNGTDSNSNVPIRVTGLCPVSSVCTAPISDFIPTSANISINSIITYTDISSNNPTSWRWLFPGGTPGAYNGQSPPPIQYNVAGSYDVQLITNNFCGSDTLMETAIINVSTCPKPAAAITSTSTTINIGGAITFTDVSTNNPTNWQWTFAGGTPSSYNGQTPPAIQYNSTGNFDVQLITSNSCGADTDKIIGMVTVSQGSSIYSCIKPFSQFPIDGASDIATQTHFQWEAVPGNGVTYDLDVRQPGATTADIFQSGLTQTRFEYTGQLNTATNYQWKVRARINGDTTSWSNTNTFTIRDIYPSSGWGSPLGQYNNATVIFNDGADSCNSCAHPNLNNQLYCPDPCASQTGATTGLKWQCVEYVNRYYKQVYGLHTYSAGLAGSANTYLSLANHAGMIRFQNNNPEKPRTGDVIVWAGTQNNTAGHVAVIKQVNGNTVTIIQQNAHSTWTNTTTLLTNNFWAFPTSPSVGPCLGWYRPQPNPLSPANGETINDLLHLFNWNTNPSENNSLHNQYTLFIYEKDANGCYQPYLTQFGISQPQFQLTQPLHAGKDYSYQIFSNTPSGTVRNETVYFSVSPNAHMIIGGNNNSRSTGDSLATQIQIHTYQNISAQDYAIANVRIYAQQQGSWTDFEWTNATGDIFVYDLYPGVHIGDSILAQADGFTDKTVVVTQDNLNSGVVNIQMNLINGTTAIINPAAIPYINGSPKYNDYVTQPAINLHVTAINHDYYEIAGFSELDNSPSWDYHLASDSVVLENLSLGDNSFTIRYINATDTLYYMTDIQYIPLDSLSNSTYVVTIAQNSLNNGARMFVNGNFIKELSTQQDSIRVPVGTNNFSFLLPGYENFNATTFHADTINIQWLAYTTGLDKIEDKFEFSVYPNPLAKTTTVSYSLATESNISISFFDLMGNETRLLPNQQQSPGIHHSEVDVAVLSSGMYLCALKVGTRVFYKKVAIIR